MPSDRSGADFVSFLSDFRLPLEAGDSVSVWASASDGSILLQTTDADSLDVAAGRLTPLEATKLAEALVTASVVAAGPRNEMAGLSSEAPAGRTD